MTISLAVVAACFVVPLSWFARLNDDPIEKMPAGVAFGLFLLAIGLIGWAAHSPWWMISAGVLSTLMAASRLLLMMVDQADTAANRFSRGMRVEFQDADGSIDSHYVHASAQARPKRPDPDPADEFETDDEAIAHDGWRWSEGEAGPRARFTYVDRDGVVTDRELRNWRSSGACINGVCTTGRGNRTFRKDRIADWDEELL
jgi:hypothetical protein